MLARKPASVSAADAARAADAGRVVVYWRKGCPFCQRLQLWLGRRVRDVVWVDVWADPEASAYVRSVNDGDEVVPTVIIDGRPHTNPPPRTVVAALGG
jgi:glutaredoxin